MAGQVVFLCTGNICRSPLAEVLAARMFAATGIRFVSAGLDTVAGLPASRHSVAYAARVGLSLAGHVSQPVTSDLLADTAWVVGMTRSHAAIFRSRWATKYGGAVGVIGAAGLDLGGLTASPVVEEIEDPYGQGADIYLACGGRIARLLDGWRDTFTKLAAD